MNIDLNAKDKYGQTAFISSCKNGHVKIAKMIVQKTSEFNIDLNAKDRNDKTAFNVACEYKNSKVAKMLAQKSAKFHIDLNVKMKMGGLVFIGHLGLAGNPKLKK